VRRRVASHLVHVSLTALLLRMESPMAQLSKEIEEHYLLGQEEQRLSADQGELLAVIESEPSIVGASTHFITVAYR
jgi:hypothetical protein